MAKSKDHFEKNKKNIITHNYEYRVSWQGKIIDDIKDLERQVTEKYRQLGGRICVYIPHDHPIFESGVLQSATNNQRHLTEVSGYFQRNGIDCQKRELAHIERIEQNADMTAVLDPQQKYVRDISDEKFTLLDCFYHGDKSIIRLGGVEKKEFEER